MLCVFGGFSLAKCMDWVIQYGKWNWWYLETSRPEIHSHKHDEPRYKLFSLNQAASFVYIAIHCISQTYHARSDVIVNRYTLLTAKLQIVTANVITCTLTSRMLCAWVCTVWPDERIIFINTQMFKHSTRRQGNTYSLVVHLDLFAT